MTTLLALRQQQRLEGTIAIPGDSKIAHRALVFNAIAEGNARLRNLPNNPSIAQTIACLQALGVEIQPQNDGVWVFGVGLRGIKAPKQALPAIRSRDTLILLLALLAGRTGISVELHGEQIGSIAELQPLIESLRLLGAQIQADQWPIRMQGATLLGTSIAIEQISEEQQTALLLAALLGYGALTIHSKPNPIDHTARMLNLMGIDLSIQRNKLTLFPPAHPVFPYPLSSSIPSDPDLAAWWWALACLHSNAQLTTPAMLVHPARNGALHALQAFAANITLAHEREHMGERIADIQTGTSQLKSTILKHTNHLAPWQIGVLALVAAHAQGQSRISVESLDFLQQHDLLQGLQAFGITAEYQAQDLLIRGNSKLQQAQIIGGFDFAPVWVLAAILAETEPIPAHYSIYAQYLNGIDHGLAMLESH